MLIVCLLRHHPQQPSSTPSSSSFAELSRSTYRIRRPSRKGFRASLAGLAGLALIASSGVARASGPSSATTLPNDEPPPRRYEFLPVPNIGGNSDVGVELGAAFTLVRFYDNAKPYRWLLGGVVSTSVKNDSEHGLHLVQQYHVLRFDVPNLFGGRVRIDSRLNFVRVISARWYGLGNDSHPGGGAPGSDAAHANQYVAQEVRLRSLVRVKTGTPFDAAIGVSLRYNAPELYEGSKLDLDAKNADLPGTRNAFLASLAGGVILDTRDNEFAPHKGVYYQLGAGATVGSAQRVSYGEVAGVFASYIPIARPVTLASRVFSSFQFGRVPFYDLEQGGVFNQQYTIGSALGVRGIPFGRYAGHVKMMVNYEVRTTPFPRFRVARWMLQVGTTTFLDAGRVWADYRSSAPDGRTPGIKYGVGGGFYFHWDRSSVFRVDVAYSPTDHPRTGMPVAYYVSNGLIF
ncbi:BamA/TamA family outer membrane protein [Pendulispora albinea]|uniref:Outer membrane protein assembly factor n=1 Tax=Pendulispora albinea TaxID=2741071 RepID=A0ABZ2M4Y9_9BACT